MNENTGTSDERANALLVPAAVLSFLAGLWMLLGATWMHGVDWGQYHEGHMMHNMRPWLWHHSLMGSYVSPMGWPWPGVIAGFAVLISSVLLYVNPRRNAVWGVIILASSAIILLTSMGGFLPGALGIAGGVMALVSTRESKQTGESSRNE